MYVEHIYTYVRGTHIYICTWMCLRVLLCLECDVRTCVCLRVCFCVERGSARLRASMCVGALSFLFPLSFLCALVYVCVCVRVFARI